MRRNSRPLFGRDFEQKKSNKQQSAIPCRIFLTSGSVGNNCLTGTLLDPLPLHLVLAAPAVEPRDEIM